MISTALERVEDLASDVGDAFARADLAVAANNLRLAEETDQGLRVMALADADFHLGIAEGKLDDNGRHECREIRQLIYGAREESRP